MNASSSVRQAYDTVFGGTQNMGTGERIVSTGLGLAMAAGGVRKGASLPGAIMGLVGAALVARGMSGHCPLKASLSGGGSGGGWMGGDHRRRLTDRSEGRSEVNEEMARPVSTQAM